MENEEGNSASVPIVVFINRIDTFFGRILAQHLGRSRPGATKSENSKNNFLENFENDFFDEIGSPDCFQIIGSYRLPVLPVDPLIPVPDGPRPPPKIPAVRELFSVDSKTDLEKAVDSAKIHIYHTVDEDGENQLFSDTFNTLAIAKTQISASKSKKTILLVSPLMTWCKTRVKGTKEKGKEEEEEPFTELEAKKRKPHPNFKKNFEMEKDLLKFAKNSHRKVSATIVAAGILYGCGERILHWLFQEAWQNSSNLAIFGDEKNRISPCHVGDLPIFGDGNNQIPMIHVRDLTQILQNLCDSKPKIRYFFAIDFGNQTFREIVDEIKKQFGAGFATPISSETDFLEKKIGLVDIDILTADLQFKAKTVFETMKIKWIYQEGFLKNIQKIIKEYKNCRNLLPLKIAIVGPPFSGKTTLAKKIADYYKINYLCVEEILKEKERKLRAKTESSLQVAPLVVNGEESEESSDFAKESEKMGSSQKEKKFLAEMENFRAENNGERSRNFLVRIIRETLTSKPCQNQGYVLDGVPKSYDMAKELFAPVERDEEDAEEEEESVEEEVAENEEIPPFDKKIIPDHIFYLDSSLNNVLKRKMAEQRNPLPVLTEKEFEKRFVEFDAQNPEDRNFLTYFDEIENHAHWIDVSKNENEEMFFSFLSILKKVGKAHNYGLTNFEKKEKKIFDESQQIKKFLQKTEEEKTREEKIQEEKIQEEKIWKKNLEFLKIEENSKREISKIPVQKYLSEFIFPTIHEGLLQCARLMPDDPVDFLAEFFLQRSKPKNLSEIDEFLNQKNSSFPLAEAGDTSFSENCSHSNLDFSTEATHLIPIFSEWFLDTPQIPIKTAVSTGVRLEMERQLVAPPAASATSIASKSSKIKT